jgi:hypothetical protein
VEAIYMGRLYRVGKRQFLVQRRRAVEGQPDKVVVTDVESDYILGELSVDRRSPDMRYPDFDLDELTALAEKTYEGLL